MTLASKVIKLHEDQDSQPSSYLILGFEGETDLEHNHVTVVYFGKRTDEENEEIHSIVSEWYNENDPTAFEASFTEEDMFGPNKDIRVLKAEKPELFFPDLRNILSKYNASKFKDSYKPHVTTDKETYHGKVNRIIFSKDGYQTIDEWPLFDKE